MKRAIEGVVVIALACGWIGCLKANGQPIAPAPSSKKAGLTWIFSKPAGIEFTKSELTVAQYRACVADGKCTKPGTGDACNWGVVGRDDHPVNCVDWNQAIAFCAWAGGRLPTEAEWEAEASDGKKREYPWGDQEVTCDVAVWNDGCGKKSTWPVCSKEKGNSVSGLCDMSGNVWEWTSSSEGSVRIMRGGSWYLGLPDYLSVSGRGRLEPTAHAASFGFRCGRSFPTEATTTPPAASPSFPSALLTPDTICSTDDDCGLTSAVLTGDERCCPGCEVHAASKSWIASFQAACKAAPPRMCPPIGCPLALLKPKCSDGRCTAVP